MLYIVCANGKELTWHIGNPKPQAWSTSVSSSKDVIEVQADGHELEYIRENFTGIPDKRNCRVVSWKGSLAQFLYDHLV